MVNVIDTRNSVLNTFLSEIRAVDIQQDRMRFRRNLERVGERKFRLFFRDGK